MVLVECNESGQIFDVTPKEYWIRTRVHEYDGGVYTLIDQFVYFVNFTDQRIYRQSLTEKQPPRPLTPEKNSDGSLGKQMRSWKEFSKDFKIEYKRKEDCMKIEVKEPPLKEVIAGGKN